MRCECCNNPLSDKEATARFASENKDDPPRYVGMCKKCQKFLPDGITIVNRPDLEDTLPDFDLPLEIEINEEDDYGYED